ARDSRAGEGNCECFQRLWARSPALVPTLPWMPVPAGRSIENVEPGYAPAVRPHAVLRFQRAAARIPTIGWHRFPLIGFPRTSLPLVRDLQAVPFEVSRCPRRHA